VCACVCASACECVLLCCSAPLGFQSPLAQQKISKRAYVCLYACSKLNKSPTSSPAAAPKLSSLLSPALQRSLSAHSSVELKLYLEHLDVPSADEKWWTLRLVEPDMRATGSTGLHRYRNRTQSFMNAFRQRSESGASTPMSVTSNTPREVGDQSGLMTPGSSVPPSPSQGGRALSGSPSPFLQVCTP
jgi:hypothetical protein